MAVDKVKPIGYPKMDVPDSKKDEAYHREWAKAIERAVRTDRSGLGGVDRNRFALNRLYGMGEQPASLYKDYKFGESSVPNSTEDQDGSWNNPGKGAREGYQHLDYTPISVMPRIKDKLKGFLQNVDYNVLIDNVDERSGAEKEEKKWRLWVQKEHGDFINQFKENADIPIQQPTYLPSSPYELDLFEKVGGFKLQIAKTMEKLVGHSFEISDWDNDLRDAFIDELLDNGYAYGKVDLDPEDGKWKVKYVDLLDAIIPWTDRYENHEMPYAGEYDWMTIAELRQHIDMPEEKIADLAQQFSGKHGNPTKSTWGHTNQQATDGSYGYDSYRVQVMHIEWIDESQKQTMYYKNRYGKDSAFKLKEGEKVKELDQKQYDRGVRQRIETTNYRVLRKTSWVVDSEVVFDWGLSNFMDRPVKNKVIPSYFLVKLNNKPPTERLIPVMDDLMISWLKYQDARAMAIEHSYAIDFSMLQNITDGDKKYSLLEILEMWREQKILLFQGSLSGKYEGGATVPVQQLPGNITAAIADATDMWKLAMMKIEDLTGLSPVALGAMPNAQQTARGTELSMSATSDILKPIIKKMLTIKEKAAKSLMRRLRQYCVNDYMDVYEPMIGKVEIRRLKEAEKSAVQYGMSFEARPTEEAKRDLIEVINASMNNRRQGMAGISLSVGAWAIEQLHTGGNMKEIRMIIAYHEDKSQEQLDAQKDKAIQMQGEQNERLKQLEMQAQQQEQQAKMAEIQAETQSELQQIQASMAKEVLVDYMKEHPEEAKRFIEGSGQGGDTPNNANEMPSEALSPEGGGNVPLEQESV